MTDTRSLNERSSDVWESWVPMIAIALGQMIMSFNVASLPVALSGMVEAFSVPPTTVANGIVAYSMLVAGFVMLGAKLTQRYGATRVFRAAVAMFCASQILMTLSPTAAVMITAQALCGASAAVIVPALVALIAEQYTGRQQETAVGALGSAPPPVCSRSSSAASSVRISVGVRRSGSWSQRRRSCFS
jgi:MFS family permease